jgi:hypothetical protein
MIISGKGLLLRLKLSGAHHNIEIVTTIAKGRRENVHLYYLVIIARSSGWYTHDTNDGESTQDLLPRGAQPRARKKIVDVVPVAGSTL